MYLDDITARQVAENPMKRARQVVENPMELAKSSNVSAMIMEVSSYLRVPKSSVS